MLKFVVKNALFGWFKFHIICVEKFCLPLQQSSLSEHESTIARFLNSSSTSIEKVSFLMELGFR
jgi:hypothetical protein